jgi:hypothetical protein
VEPYYDPKTDRIVGCKPGTWQYSHELRHRWQFKKYPRLEESITKVHIRSYYASIIASILLTILFGFKGVIIGVGMGMLPHILLTAIMELDAYVVGTYYHLAKKRAIK